jgi:hypothetical protein
MPQFSPDIVAFGDLAGYGAWDIGHMREHLQFVQILSQQTPGILIPDFDFLTFLASGPAANSILQSHQNSHALLNSILGITSIDLSEVDLTKENDFENWIGYHQSAHQAIRQQLGITT